MVDVGRGSRGYTCQPALYISPGGGLHAGTHGSEIPFDLRGGSRGGDLDNYGLSCLQWLSTGYGGSGGGTIALHAGGRIEIHGSVTADGWHPGRTSGGGGSGGSILLRGDAGVHVFPGGSVTARGGTITNPINPVINGAPGYVRLDAWGAPPIIQGTIDPPATVLELPHLRTTSPPQIGTTWSLDILAPQNAPVFVSGSLLPVAGTPTPFGPLGIDLSVAASLGVSVPQPSHDPIASMPMAIPNAPALIGLSLWAQGIAVPQALAPRLTNTVAVTVQ